VRAVIREPKKMGKILATARFGSYETERPSRTIETNVIIKSGRKDAGSTIDAGSYTETGCRSQGGDSKDWTGLCACIDIYPLLKEIINGGKEQEVGGAYRF